MIDGSNEVPVRLLRNSERKSYQACRWQWWMSYVNRYETKTPKAALEFGGAIHKALEGWYIPGRKRGTAPWATWATLMDQYEEEHGERFVMPDGEDARELGHDMLRGYVRQYGKDEHLEVISAEMSFQVPATRADKTPVYVTGKDGVRRRLVHVGTGDIVVRDLARGQIGVMETKTAAKIETGHLGMDDQASSYWTLVPAYLREQGLLKPQEDISFIEYNFLRKGKADDRPTNAKGEALNKNGTVSKNQPTPLFRRHRFWRGTSDRLSFLRRINNIAAEMALVERGKLPIYKNPSSAYPDQHCKGCEFYDVCMLHEIDSDWQAVVRQTMKKWDPYESHERKEEAE